MREESYKTTFKKVGKTSLASIIYLVSALFMPDGIISGLLLFCYIGYIFYIRFKPNN